MDQHDNKESSLIVDTPQPPELPTQRQRRRPSLFFLQLNETDGIIVVEPTVLNSVLEVGLCGHFRAIDDDESVNLHHYYFLSQHCSFDRSCLETSSSSSRCRAPQCQIRRNLVARQQHCPVLDLDHYIVCASYRTEQQHQQHNHDNERRRSRLGHHGSLATHTV